MILFSFDWKHFERIKLLFTNFELRVEELQIPLDKLPEDLLSLKGVISLFPVLVEPGNIEDWLFFSDIGYVKLPVSCNFKVNL